MVFSKPETVWVPSPHFGYPQGRHGRNGQQIIGICYHIAEGSRGSVESWFRSPQSQASSHFLIARDGALVQFVAEEDAAWTQGDTADTTWPLYDPSVNPNLVLLSIEHEGYHNQPWTEAMIQADIDLTLYLCERHNIPPRRPHLLGHYEINRRSRLNCPGPHFPWARVIDGVQRTWAREKFPWMHEALAAGEAAGLTDGTRPLDFALRGEAMTVFVRLLEEMNLEPEGEDPGPQAPDAPTWMQPFIRKAMQYGISDGLRPLEPATREETITMAVRTLDRIDPDRAADGAQNPIDRAQEEEISDGSRPIAPVLRGEVVTMAVRLMERVVPH